MYKLTCFLVFIAFCAGTVLKAQVIPGEVNFITTTKEKGCFTISSQGKSSPLLFSSGDFTGVKRALKDLQTDIGKVTSFSPKLFSDTILKEKEIIIVGTIGKSQVIDNLIKTKKINVTGIEGKWESYLIQVVNKPLPGINRALVIAGSDKRATIYGIYDISEMIGVSPWCWWGDVPVNHKDALFAKQGRYIQGPPTVKYRGIFLNDEAPALTNWIKGKYGIVAQQQNPPIPGGVADYGREFYTKLFELLLRLKGNYLWPAMWNNAFNEDDPENPKLADEYGIVMGNSHQEPMLRAQKEWDRRYQRTLGSWNYSKNPDVLENFWREGIKRNRNFESIVTIGLRGANDTEMAAGGPAANKTMLEKIVDVQRKILADEINPDVTKVPQLWCLYKEVQDYYKAGMRVPDDVTLLWTEDNWGNIRRLPTAEERKRAGGAGIYYHFDYHGGPRSYQWINTNPIAKIYDQMSLAKQYGADKVWIVNVGHFKGYEFPMEYFLKLGWNSGKLTNDNINEYTRLWAAREFGPEYSKEIAEIISRYTKYNGRRKPELLDPTTYSLINYNEAENVVSEYKSLTLQAEGIYDKLDQKYKDAFYQLVLFPTKACSIVNELYFTAGRNRLYAIQGRASTNDMAGETQKLFQADTILMGNYNREFANGKWNHFMDQAHLGYTSWVDPPINSLRAIKLAQVVVYDTASMGISLEGSDSVWPDIKGEAVLPEFDIFNKHSHYLEIFNKGKVPFEFKVTTGDPWITISETRGKIEKDKRIQVSVDWNKAPKGETTGTVKVEGTDTRIDVKVIAFNPAEINPESLKGFVEGEGYVSIEAEHFTRKTDAGTNRWIKIDDYGHTLSAMRATADVDAPSAMPGKDSPCLEYQMYLFSTGKFDITLTLSPTLNFIPDRSLKYGISIDDEASQIVTAVPENYNAQNRNTDWEKSVRDNARFCTTSHTITKPGYHILKIWMIDPGVVLQKIVVNTGGVKPSYLGPPESYTSFHPAL